MAVLVEAISVVVRREAIEERFRGGWEAFQESVPNQTLCFDDELARVGFMAPSDTEAFIERLEAAGLAFERNGKAVDLAVADQLRGLTVPAAWLEFGNVELDDMSLAACWLRDTSVSELAVPAGWKYEGSMGAKPGFSKVGTEGDHLKFLRRENNMDVYLDLTTDKEVFVARPAAIGESPAALHSRLEAICHEALKIDSEIGPLKSMADAKSLEPLAKRLNLELLLEAKEIADGPGNEMSFSHFTVGLVLRVAFEYGEAEVRFRKANEIRSESLNTLRELVRCLGEQGKKDEALRFARETVDVAPQDSGGWGNLAMCLIQLGEKKEAKEAIDHALELDPQDPLNRTIRDNFENYFSGKKQVNSPESPNGGEVSKTRKRRFRILPLCVLGLLWPVIAFGSGFDGALSAIATMAPCGALIGVGLFFFRRAYRQFLDSEIGPGTGSVLIVLGLSILALFWYEIGSKVSFYSVSGSEEPMLFTLGILIGGILGWFVIRQPKVAKESSESRSEKDFSKEDQGQVLDSSFRFLAFQKHSRFTTSSGKSLRQYSLNPKCRDDLAMVLPLLQNCLEEEGFSDLSWRIDMGGGMSVLGPEGKKRIAIPPQLEPHLTGVIKEDGTKCGIHVKISRSYENPPRWSVDELSMLLKMDSEENFRVFLAPAVVIPPPNCDSSEMNGFRIDYRGLRWLMQGCQFE